MCIQIIVLLLFYDNGFATNIIRFFFIKCGCAATIECNIVSEDSFVSGRCFVGLQDELQNTIKRIQENYQKKKGEKDFRLKYNCTEHHYTYCFGIVKTKLDTLFLNTLNEEGKLKVKWLCKKCTNRIKMLSVYK